MVFAIFVIVVVIIALATALTRAEEQDGLPEGFGRRIIGRKHGVLVEATQVDESNAPRSTFVRNALITGAIFIVLPILINIPTSGSIEQSVLYITNTYSAILTALVMAFCARPSLGLRRSAFHAVAGGLTAVLLPLVILALLRGAVSTEIGNTVLFFSFIIGALCGAYLAPSNHTFARTFADGYTDTISVSENSAAHKAFLCLSTDVSLRESTETAAVVTPT